MRKQIASKPQASDIDMPVVDGSKTNDPKIIRANLNRKTVQSENFVSLYTNDAQVQLSPWDIRLILGIIADEATPGNETVTVKLVGEVRMSPQFAKRLAIVLIQQLKTYEDTIGAIPLPKV